VEGYQKLYFGLQSATPFKIIIHQLFISGCLNANNWLFYLQLIDSDNASRNT